MTNQDAVLLDLPDQLVSERLLIRPPRPGDGESIHEALVASRKELLPWMAWAQEESTVLDAEANARKALARFISREELRLLVFRKADGVLLGSTGFHHIDWSIPKLEIGYWIHSAYGGHGYMTEAVATITQFALAELRASRIEIRCDAENQRSAAIPLRLGFKLEARLRESSRSIQGDRLTDTLVFAAYSDWGQSNSL